MTKLRMILAGAAAAVVWASASVAAPLTPSSGTPAVGGNDLVHQAQAMCQYPNGAWGPCRGFRRPPPPPVYVPPPRYREPRYYGGGRGGTVYTPFCMDVYSRCAARFGQGTLPYQRCAISRGCT